MNEINGFVLQNEEKLDRAINGSMGQKGQLKGDGVGQDAKPEAILAAYDKLGGLITKDGNKVNTGSFWDFEAKAPRKEPVITFEVELDGETVIVSEDEVKAISTAKKKKDAIKKKVKRSK